MNLDLIVLCIVASLDHFPRRGFLLFTTEAQLPAAPPRTQLLAGALGAVEEWFWDGAQWQGQIFDLQYMVIIQVTR
jgi:hypothetical protein